MKKNTMETLVRYLNGETVDNLDEIKAELEAELAKNAEKAQANRELYDATHDVFVNALTDTPQTLAEIWERIKDEVPGGMTKSKIQYACANTGLLMWRRLKVRLMSIRGRKPSFLFF